MNVIVDDCDKDYEKLIIDGIVEFNNSQVTFTQSKPFQYPKFKASVDDQFAGGILGKLYCWGCLYIDVLYVKPDFRRIGIGTLLLNRMHDYALENGCSLIHLDTFDFQAKEFYQGHGYEVFGILENCPPGHSRIYMKREMAGKQ